MKWSKLRTLFIFFLFLAAAAIWEPRPTVQAACVPTTHTVKAGETLFGLATQYGLTVDELAAANQIDDINLVQVGQVLQIPCPAETTTGKCQPQTHIVAAGETLLGIAQQYHVNKDTIIARNHISNPDMIQSGTMLIITPCLSLTDVTGVTLLLGQAGFLPLPLPGLNDADALAWQNLYDADDEAAKEGGIQQIVVSPPIITQGRTGWLYLSTTHLVTVTTNNASSPLFIMPTDGGFWGLVSVNAMAPRGLQELTIQVRSNKQRVTLHWPLLVESGGYITQTIVIPPDRQTLLNPQTVKGEIAFLAHIWAQAVGPPLWQGAWRKPFDGDWPPTSPFGIRRHYAGGAGLDGFHCGQDFAIPAGTPVIAPANGIVLYAGPLKVRGNVVILSHGAGVASGYWHLSRVQVVKGEKVQAGQQIALSGNTGLSTGAHLHWEVRANGVAVSPWQWLQPDWPSTLLRFLAKER